MSIDDSLPDFLGRKRSCSMWKYTLFFLLSFDNNIECI